METPDFDHYPTARHVQGAAVLPLGLEARWDDGAVTTHHALWLRENAPGPETTHPDTREQALQLEDIPKDLRVLSASPSQGGGLAVRFSDGTEAQYHPGWLRAFARETQEAPLPCPRGSFGPEMTLPPSPASPPRPSITILRPLRPTAKRSTPWASPSWKA